jgi:2-haloacid dehalogenase
MPDLNLYTTILLDLDHTLFDFDQSETLAFRNTMDQVGVHDSGECFARYDSINRQLWLAVERNEISVDEVSYRRFELLAEELDLQADAQQMSDSFADGLGRFGDLYPGVREVLETLANRSTLALVTNGLSAVQRTRIARLDIGQYFSAIAISAELGTSKPGTPIFDATFAMLNDPDKSRCVMVGDSLSSDIRGGTNFGIATCWYNPSGKVAGPDYRIDHQITSLVDLI